MALLFIMLVIGALYLGMVVRVIEMFSLSLHSCVQLCRQGCTPAQLAVWRSCSSRGEVSRWVALLSMPCCPCFVVCFCTCLKWITASLLNITLEQNYPKVEAFSTN